MTKRTTQRKPGELERSSVTSIRRVMERKARTAGPAAGKPAAESPAVVEPTAVKPIAVVPTAGEVDARSTTAESMARSSTTSKMTTAALTAAQVRAAEKTKVFWPKAGWTAALRDRVLERLRDARVPVGHAQALHLAGITGRAYQTTRRWIDGKSPGLPDLASFRLLCEGIDGDPMWLLGLTDEKRSLREAVGPSGARGARAAQAGVRVAVQTVAEDDVHEPAKELVQEPAQEPVQSEKEPVRGAVGKQAWLDDVSRAVSREMFGCRARRMRGDEMEPEIYDGDTLFIDPDIRAFEGHGTYLIGCEGQELIRRLEYTVGKGLVVSCANPRYEAAVFRDAAETLDHGLHVLGRVEGVVQVRRFWRVVRRSEPAR